MFKKTDQSKIGTLHVDEKHDISLTDWRSDGQITVALIHDKVDIQHRHKFNVNSATERGKFCKVACTLSKVDQSDLATALLGVPIYTKEADGRSGGSSTEGESKTPVLIQASTVEPEEIKWLWYPLLPVSKMVLVEGDPGVGKTWLSLEILKTITLGGKFPDLCPSRRDQPIPPGNVIYASAEDGIADTLVPRLIAAGADTSKVFFLTGYHDKSKDEDCSISMQDIDELRKAVDKYAPVVVVFDPIQAYLGPKVDMNKANEVRRVLSPIVSLAEEFNFTCIAIRHLTKGGRDNPMYRGMGSIDFTAAVRSQIMVGRDPDNSERRIVVQVKTNLAELGPSLAFVIKNDRLSWDGLSDLTAKDLCMPVEGNTDDEKTAMMQANDFIVSMLADGPVSAGEIKKEARGAAITEITLRRASKAIDVKMTRESTTNGKRGKGKWMWSLPSSYQLIDGKDAEVSLDTNTMITMIKLNNDSNNNELGVINQLDHMIKLNNDSNPNENNKLRAIDQVDHPTDHPVDQVDHMINLNKLNNSNKNNDFVQLDHVIIPDVSCSADQVDHVDHALSTCT